MIGKHLYRVDKNGFPTSSVIVYFDEERNLLTEVEDDIIQVPMPQGLYRPRWNGTEWVEYMTQEEIDELYKSQSTDPSKLELLQEQVLQLQEYIVNQEKENLLMKGGIIDVI